MEYLLICTVALLASTLTLFSGFGLGTILLPAFALFFPIEIAIALTAVVHFLNNVFKLALLGKNANGEAVVLFGLPAVIASFAGAKVLLWLGHLQPIYSYEFMGHPKDVTIVKLTVAGLMMVFALWEVLPSLKEVSFDKRFLPLGGILSGFFGGLSGQQGALRSAFLVRTGLLKESFIATGIVIACLVDTSRLFVYSHSILNQDMKSHVLILSAAAGSAFIGALLGNHFMKKATLEAVQVLVAVMLFIIALLLCAGLI